MSRRREYKFKGFLLPSIGFLCLAEFLWFSDDKNLFSLFRCFNIQNFIPPQEQSIFVWSCRARPLTCWIFFFFSSGRVRTSHDKPKFPPLYPSGYSSLGETTDGNREKTNADIGGYYYYSGLYFTTPILMSTI